MYISLTLTGDEEVGAWTSESAPLPGEIVWYSHYDTKENTTAYRVKSREWRAVTTERNPDGKVVCFLEVEVIR